jgi:membrane-associated phospholipid phosphatase
VLHSAWALALALSLQSAPAAPPASPPARSVQPPSITRMWQNVRHDFRGLAAPDTAFIGSLGLTSALVAHPSDRSVADWARADDGPSAVRVGGVVGDAWFQSGLALGLYATGTLAKSPGLASLGGDLVRAQVVNAVLTRGIKLAAGRRRPNGGHDAMPSGHTSATMATAAIVDAHFGWKVGVPAYALAGFVGWTRVRGDSHWLSDVAAGAAIGAISARAVLHGRHVRGWTITPTASAGGAAIYVVKTE